MYKSLLTQIIATSIALFTILPSIAAEPNKKASDTDRSIRISTIEYPPLFQSQEIPGKGYGVASDLTVAAFKAVNIKVTFDYIPMARSVISVVTKRHPANLGSINWFIKDQKQQHVDVVNLFNINFMLFYRKNRFPSGISYEHLSELQDFSIGNVRGSSTTPIVNNANLNLRWITALEQNFKMLNANRIDLAIGGETAGWALIKSLYPNTVDNFAVVKKPVHRVPIGLVFHKEQKLLSEQFNKGIDTILKNGTYFQILERYYGKEHISRGLLTKNIIEKQIVIDH